MAWPYRKQNLLRELLTRRPDIMCLQEVQSDHYKCARGAGPGRG